MDLSKQYKKYKWFFTSSEKIVIGGKSAVQNEELLEKILKSNEEYIIMHTSSPGSPFSIILAEIDKITPSDLQECAIFTACFSRSWKLGKKQEQVDIFSSNQLKKEKDMKTGTWGVVGKVKRVIVNLELSLTKQKGVLRAIPPQSLSGKKPILKIIPGDIDKTDMMLRFQIELGPNIKQEEILSALPSGGVKIIK